MPDRPVFLYAAVYDDIADAESDYEGQVRVHKTEKPTQHGAWTGIAVGAVAGILFPPAIIGGAAGGVAGHLWRGMSRGDLKELGEALDEGQAAVIVIGESRIDEQIAKATRRASKVLAKEVDADPDELKREIQEAEKQGAPA